MSCYYVAICSDIMKCTGEQFKINKGISVPIRTEEFPGNITMLKKAGWQ